MSGQPLPEIRLELNSGTFKIKTPAAIYVITVQPVGTVAQEITQVVEQEVASEMISDGAETSNHSRGAAISMEQTDGIFYKDVSISMLGRIGELAKKLNISLKELSNEVPQGIDLGKSGRRLSDAMEQLEEINVMTENAAMVIMDLTEKIQEDIGWTKENIKVLNEIDLASDEDVDSAYQEAEKMCGVVKTHRPIIDEIVSSEQELLASLFKLSELAGETENKDDAEKFYEFDPDAIFQTLYEFCTNEAVKKHLKTMREDKQACNTPRFNIAINESLKGIKFENNFIDIPIKSILAAFLQATDSEKYRGFLEKLDTNLSSLFLESHLPVEIPNPRKVSENEGEDSTILAMVSDIANRAEVNLEKLAKVKTDFFDNQIDSSILKDLEDKTVIKRKDRDTIKKILDESNLRFSSIMDLATKIFENLSFQDLAGQKIRKIIKLLTEFQAQLLMMLVGFDVQIRTKECNKNITAAESEKLVQGEVDKVLASVMVGTEGEAMEKRFDQDAVNEILESMGF